jgi:hypothetical protein
MQKVVESSCLQTLPGSRHSLRPVERARLWAEMPRLFSINSRDLKILAPAELSHNLLARKPILSAGLLQLESRPRGLQSNIPKTANSGTLPPLFPKDDCQQGLLHRLIGPRPLGHRKFRVNRRQCWNSHACRVGQALLPCGKGTLARVGRAKIHRGVSTLRRHKSLAGRHDFSRAGMPAKVLGFSLGGSLFFTP